MTRTVRRGPAATCVRSIRPAPTREDLAEFAGKEPVRAPAPPATPIPVVQRSAEPLPARRRAAAAEVRQVRESPSPGLDRALAEWPTEPWLRRRWPDLVLAMLVLAVVGLLALVILRG
jgi:hypothetical protein